MRFVFASHNAHKRGEVAAIMGEVWPEVELVAPEGEPPVEDGESFAENALIKARAAYAATGMPSIADDSGICVNALDGAPGIHSARYNPSGDDADNVTLLLDNLTGAADRSGYFVCVAALVDDAGEHVVERRWHGTVATEAHGEGGFGYDPVFIPEGLNHTAAQLDPAEKNRISHRGQAFRALADDLRERYGS